MDVDVDVLRAQMAKWIERVRNGEEVIVTDRGTPVARLVAVDSAPLLDDLVRRNVLGPQRAPRPSAGNAKRVKASKPVSPLISDDRR